MRSFYEFFKIDGKPILAPDQDVGISKQDLDAEGSGRDELGYMHRIVARERVAKWQLDYAILTEQEYEYMNKLFEGKSDFEVEIKSALKRSKTRAYCSGVKASIHNGLRGIYKGVSFSVIEC